MARLSEGTKPVTQLGPTISAIQDKAPARPDYDLSGPIQTAASYGERVKARQAMTAELKKKKVPLGGVPPIEEGKVKAAVEMMRQPSYADEDTPRRPDGPPQAPIVQGMGSAYAVNQAMAAGQLDRPVSMKEARKMESERKPLPKKDLSPETKDLLQKVKDANDGEEAQVAEAPKSDAETSVDLDMAEDQAVSQALQPPLDFPEIERQQNMLITKERRKTIEARLSPLEVGDLVMKRELVQDIPVIVDAEGKQQLVYTLRTYRQHEYLFCLRYVYENPGSAVFTEELLTTCKMVCSVVAINGGLLPDHRTNVGTSKERVDKDAFEKKFHYITGLPVHLLADLSVQWSWFNNRVNKLFNVADLKNG